MDLFVQKAVGGLLVKIPAPLAIMLVLIFIFFGLGIRCLYILQNKQKKLLKEVKKLKEDIRGLIVEEIIEEYDASINAGNEQVNTYAILSKAYIKHVVQQKLLNREFDFERTVGFCVNSLVILGLIGTFLGLSQTLYEIKGILSVLKQSGGSEQNAPMVDYFGNIIDSLTVPLSKMSTAFVASLMGISLSLVLNSFVHIFRTEENKQVIFSELEDYLDNYHQPRVRKSTATKLMESQNELLKDFLTGFSKTIEEGFSKSINNLTGSIGNVTGAIKNTMEGFGIFLQDRFAKVVQEIGDQNKSTMSKIDIVIMSLDNVVGEFQNGVQYLESVGSRFEGYVQDMTSSGDVLRSEIVTLKYSVLKFSETVSELVKNTDTLGGSLQQMNQGVEETLQKVMETQQEAAQSAMQVRQEQNEQILKLFKQMEKTLFEHFDKLTSIMMKKIQEEYGGTIAQTNALFKDMAGSFEKGVEEMHHRITEIHAVGQDRVIRAVAGLQKDTAKEISNINKDLMKSVKELSNEFGKMVKGGEAALTLVIKDWGAGVNDLIFKTNDTMKSLQQNINSLNTQLEDSATILAGYVQDLHNAVMKNTADYLDKVYVLAVNAEQTITDTIVTWGKGSRETAASTDKLLRKLAKSADSIGENMVSLTNEALNNLTTGIINMEGTISSGLKTYNSISSYTGKKISDLQMAIKENHKDMNDFKNTLKKENEWQNANVAQLSGTIEKLVYLGKLDEACMQRTEKQNNSDLSSQGTE